jgi:hypothetical protein
MGSKSFIEWTSWNTTANVRFGAARQTRYGQAGFAFSERLSGSKPGELTSRLQASLGPYVARLNFSSNNFMSNWAKYDMGTDFPVLKDVSLDLGVQGPKISIPGMNGKIKLVEGVSVPDQLNPFIGVSISAAGIMATASLTGETTGKGKLLFKNDEFFAGPIDLSVASRTIARFFNEQFRV